MMVLAMEKTGARRGARVAGEAGSTTRADAGRSSGMTPLQRELKRLNLQLADLRRRTAAVPRLERAVRQLAVDVAELRRRADGSNEDVFERSAWLAQHGIKPADVEMVHPRPFGEVAMTVSDAAAELGLSLEQVRRHLRAGHIAGIPRRGPGGWVVSRESVADFQRERTELMKAGRERRRVRQR